MGVCTYVNYYLIDMELHIRIIRKSCTCLFGSKIILKDILTIYSKNDRNDNWHIRHKMRCHVTKLEVEHHNEIYIRQTTIIMAIISPTLLP